MTDYPLQVRTYEQLLGDFDGELPSSTKILNLIHTLYQKRMGWRDYNDAATAVTPIALTLVDTYYPVTNDGLGPYSISDYIIDGLEAVWNTTTNQLNFTELSLGDVITLRINMVFNSSSPNSAFKFRFKGAVGDASEYTINLHEAGYKTAGSHPISLHVTIPMEYAVTLNNPGQLEVSCDTSGATVEVVGFVVKLDKW